jgi:hypothetical protein
MIDYEEFEKLYEVTLQAFWQTANWVRWKLKGQDLTEAIFLLERIRRHMKDPVEGCFRIDVSAFLPACNRVEVGTLQELARCFERVQAPAVLIVPFDPVALGISSKYMRTSPV